MSSLSHLLDGSNGVNGGFSSPAGANSSYAATPVAPKPKRKRPSRAAAAFIDEEDIANRRVSRRPASSPPPRPFCMRVADDAIIASSPLCANRPALGGTTMNCTRTTGVTSPSTARMDAPRRPPTAAQTTCLPTKKATDS